MHSRSLRFVPTGLLSLSFLLLAGCEGGPDRRAMEETRRSVPPMAANETFFDGKIAAHLTLGSSLTQNAGPGKGPGGRGPGGMGGMGGRHMPGGGRGGEGMGGGMSGGMGRGMEGGMGEEGGGERPESDRSDNSEEVRPRIADSPMPPALMRLQLENTSGAALVVEIRDLNSELGNFATRPDTFTLEPGASGQPDPMQSLLGVDTLALPVTLTLRSGGKVETKVLTLRPIPPPPPAAPAAH